MKAAGLHLQDCLRVIPDIGVHAVDHAEIVGMAGDVRKKIGDPHPAFAILMKVPGRFPVF